jgi:hypothetical protein
MGWLLVNGYWLMVIGYWLLGYWVIGLLGYWLLVDIKYKEKQGRLLLEIQEDCLIHRNN